MQISRIFTRTDVMHFYFSENTSEYNHGYEYFVFLLMSGDSQEYQDAINMFRMTLAPLYH